MRRTPKILAAISASLFSLGCGSGGGGCICVRNGVESGASLQGHSTCQELADALRQSDQTLSHCFADNAASIAGPGEGLQFLRNRETTELDLRTTDYLQAKPRSTGVWGEPNRPR